MNKALHVFVYIFLILAGVALYLESELNAKRELLTDRNRLQEDYLVKIAGTIENEDPPKDMTAEIKKDISPVEAKIVDTPETENVLEDYKSYLERDNLPTFKWEDQAIRDQLRAIYVFDAEGKVVMDGTRPLMKGPGTEDELLSKLLDACQNQQAKLNTTRGELRVLHEKLEVIVDELNKLKPVARQDKVTIVEREEKIAKLEGEKTELENTIARIKGQIAELNQEIVGLKDDLVAANGETEAAKEELAKSQALVEKLKKLIQELTIRLLGQGESGRGTAVASVPHVRHREVHAGGDEGAEGQRPHPAASRDRVRRQASRLRRPRRRVRRQDPPAPGNRRQELHHLRHSSQLGTRKASERRCHFRRLNSSSPRSRLRCSRAA